MAEKKLVAKPPMGCDNEGDHQDREPLLMCPWPIWLLVAFLPPCAAGYDTARLPISNLLPARYTPGLCQLHYRISTRSEECQKLFDQGLGYWYSYVWSESVRSFETAARRDPQCAMVWWGLSRALEHWSQGGGKANDALKKAYELRDKASYLEKQLIQARAILKGVAADAPKEQPERVKRAQKILDDLLLMHPEDEEAWIARALIAADGKLFGGTPASAPYYLALIRLNPLHPGANHELVHQYENSKRPALGWVHSEKYIESSPGIHHAWHMQGHLSTRLGRWEHAAEGSLKAVALQRTHNLAWKVKGSEDHQWSHHLETCLQILTHQGRFREARAIYDEMKSHDYKTPEAFARFHLALRDYSAVSALVLETRKTNKTVASYFAALNYLAQGNSSAAQTEIEVLEEGLKDAKQQDKKLKVRLWETRGLLLCRTGLVDQGLTLLQKAADESKADYSLHAWGHGGYFMEVWGLAALSAGRLEAAEEAFLEAIAHDPGSLTGAMGLQVLCERQGKSDEAKQYQAMAERAWQHADVKTYLNELAHVRQLKLTAPLTTSVGR